MLYAASILRKFGFRTDGEFLALIYCALGSLFITRVLFNYGLVGQWQEPLKPNPMKFYTKENWHPHPRLGHSTCWIASMYLFQMGILI